MEAIIPEEKLLRSVKSIPDYSNTLQVGSHHFRGLHSGCSIHDGVGRCGNRQHEGVGAADGHGEHQVDGVDPEGQSLKIESCL